jgi:nucleoside-diphosphate-sugar epimerase
LITSDRITKGTIIVSERKHILVTGATGVVGSALIPRLAQHDVIALTHRTPLDGEHVRGDLTRPFLGLDEHTYGRLAERIDVVVHAAAMTDFSAGERATADLNVAGTRRVLEFAAAARARLVYVSTAFVARTGFTRTARGGDSGEAAASPDAYLDSKRRAEQLVAASGTPAAVARPSVVIGDSRTGEIAKFQGLHGLLKALLKNRLPLVPLDPDARVDVVPADVVGDALVALVDAGVPMGEYWLTSGPAAPTARALVEQCLSVAAELGISVVGPRFVSVDMVDRLLRPVFIDPLPPHARRKFDDLMAMTALFCDAEPFPTSLGAIPAGPSTPDACGVASACAASIRHLANATGLATPAGVLGRAA